MSDEIKRLEYLSLVSKVVTELENHLDISEKCLGKTLLTAYTFSELKCKNLDSQASNGNSCFLSMLPICFYYSGIHHSLGRDTPHV